MYDKIKIQVNKTWRKLIFIYNFRYLSYIGLVFTTYIAHDF